MTSERPGAISPIPTAIFSRQEVETLISDMRVPHDRRTLYGLPALAGVRYGEAAGLRWPHLELDAHPLGRMTVATSYDRGSTKTGVERRVPIHRVLAAILAEWRLAWPSHYGRQPGPDDLVVPCTAPGNRGRRRALGSMRDKNCIGRRLEADLKLLGFRHRRGHDLRRTFITLAREDGADKDVLSRATHRPGGDIMEVYTSVPWERLCGEVAKLRLERRKLAKIQALHPESCCTDLLHAEAEARNVAGMNGGGAGNRTRVRKISSEGSYARVPEKVRGRQPPGVQPLTFSPLRLDPV